MYGGTGTHGLFFNGTSFFIDEANKKFDDVDIKLFAQYKKEEDAQKWADIYNDRPI